MIWLYVFLLDFLIPFLCDPDLQCKTIATGALAVRHSNHQARSHPNCKVNCYIIQKCMPKFQQFVSFSKQAKVNKVNYLTFPSPYNLIYSV